MKHCLKFSQFSPIEGSYFYTKNTEGTVTFVTLVSRRHGQVCLINPNVLGAVLPRTAISAWAPRKLGLILMTVGV